MSQVFSFQSRQVRTIIENGEPWFVGRDIALLLGYSKPDKEIRRICKYVKLFKGTKLVPWVHAPSGVLIIPEPDVWRLIIRSTLPGALKVEEWIMSEVLPAIRQTGKYESKPKQKALPESLNPAGDFEAVCADSYKMISEAISLLERASHTIYIYRIQRGAMCSDVSTVLDAAEHTARVGRRLLMRTWNDTEVISNLSLSR